MQDARGYLEVSFSGKPTGGAESQHEEGGKPTGRTGKTTERARKLAFLSCAIYLGRKYGIEGDLGRS